MFFKNIHIRIKIIILITSILFMLIIGKVFYIQVIQYKKLSEVLGTDYDDMLKHVSERSSIERVHPEGRGFHTMLSSFIIVL